MKNKVLDIISGIFALILVVGTLELIIWGVVALIIGIINIPKRQEETREMRTTEITVESKDKTSSGIQFVKSCLENLYQCKYDNITHLLRDGSSLIFCTYIDGKIVFAENIQVAGFKRMEQNVVYSLKELGISGSL